MNESRDRLSDSDIIESCRGDSARRPSQVADSADVSAIRPYKAGPIIRIFAPDVSLRPSIPPYEREKACFTLNQLAFSHGECVHGRRQWARSRYLGSPSPLIRMLHHRDGEGGRGMG